MRSIAVKCGRLVYQYTSWECVCISEKRPLQNIVCSARNGLKKCTNLLSKIRNDNVYLLLKFSTH